MENVNSIVVVVNRSNDSRHVLQKAATIAATSTEGARVHVIRVIHEPLAERRKLDAEQAQSLKLYLMQAEEEYLVDLVRDYREAFTSVDCSTLWNKRPSDAILQAAEDFDADLIVKATAGEGPHLFHHPDDWNLLRHTHRPVMLVKETPWVDDPVILAAVDALDSDHEDLSRRVLAEANALARALQGRLHVVSAYPPAAAWAADPGVVLDFERLRREMEQEVRTNIEACSEATGAVPRRLHLAEGAPTEVVADTVAATHAEVLVMGTLGREGLRGLVIGNTSEKLLNTVPCDVLVIHA